MSIILKGIDMPKDKNIYIKITTEKLACVYTEAEEDNRITMYETFPFLEVKEIPAPHGRLIDGDEVMKQLQADKREAFTKHDVWLMLSKYGAPTILEAEENR